MSERRSLVEGLKSTASIDDAAEQDFVYGPKSNGAAPVPVAAPVHVVTPKIDRVPISTRMRSDFSAALKRASLERQLQNIEPNTLQDILEQAIEPWLKSNGYLS